MTVETGAPSGAAVPPTGGTPTPGAPAAPAITVDPAARAAVVPAGGDATSVPLVTPVVPPEAVSLTIGDVPAVVEPVVSPETEADGKGKDVTYNPTGNAGLDIALAFIGKLGVKGDSAAMQAAEKGDFSILKAHLSTLGDKARGWEAHVALGEKGFNEIKTTVAQRQADDQAAIHKAVGGPEAWAEVKKFAAEATSDTPLERAALNQMLSVGGLQAKIAASYLATLMAQAKATAPDKEPEPVVAAGAPAPSAAPTTGALSPRQYTAEVQKLNAKLRGRMDASPEYKALQARRAMWRETR